PRGRRFRCKLRAERAQERGGSHGGSTSSLADLRNAEADVARGAVAAVVARLPDCAPQAASAAIDVGLVAVRVVIGALVRDARERSRVAGHGGPIRVAGAGSADRAERTRDAAAVAVGLVAVLLVIEAVAVDANERHRIAVTTAGADVAARRRETAVRV